MSQMQDLPPIAGPIIRARQIERQLQTYMKRVEDVLGKGWEPYAEGQKLQSESNAFHKKLDTYSMFQAWLKDISRQNMGVDLTRAISKYLCLITMFNVIFSYYILPLVIPILTVAKSIL
jgi:hypothetical protein